MGKISTLIIIFFIVIPAEIFAGKHKTVVEFSADVVRTVPGKAEPISKGRMVVSRYGIRTEGKKGGESVVFIFRPKKKLVWTLFPEKKNYEERLGLVIDRPPLPMDANSPCQKDRAVVCQLLGNTVLHNRSVEHWLLSRRTKKKLKPVVQLWIDTNLKVAIRETFLDGMTIELQNLQEKPQNIKSFIIPDGYTKKALPEKLPAKK
ncbi:MAG: hypothetical protein HQL70_00415 [Magnetococcales bacterium]|nr:hypothetical protein [Magnetococcales bacterium]